MTNTADPEGYEATTKLRGLEREVRSSKRMQAAAMDPEARAKATKRLNDYRAKIREHVATTSAKRQPWRESFGVSKKALGKTPAKIVPKLPRVEKGALKAVPLDDTDLALQGVLRSAGKGASRADINDEVMMLVGDNRLSPGEAGEIMARWDALGGKIDVVPLTSDDAAKLLPYRAPEPSVKAAQAHLDDYFKAYPDEFSGVRTLEQMRNDVEANLAERFSEAPIAIRTPSAAVDDILSDGKFSTVFDTGYTYGGDFSPEYLSGRTALEKAAFGAKPKANPIYGYSKALEDHVSGYGDVEVVLKDSVRTRSTMTIGDSMNYNIGQGGVVGRPVVAPTYECVPDEFLGSVARGDWKSFLDEGPAIGAGDYAEVQIHGGVYLDDIASFVIHAPNGPNAQQKTLLARLKSAGIDATIEATP